MPCQHSLLLILSFNHNMTLKYLGIRLYFLSYILIPFAMVLNKWQCEILHLSGFRVQVLVRDLCLRLFSGRLSSVRETIMKSCKNDYVNETKGSNCSKLLQTCVFCKVFCVMSSIYSALYL